MTKENHYMKRLVAVGVFSILGGLPMNADQQTLTGAISDSMCGANHAAMGEMGKNAKTCTVGCVKAGSKYAFVSNGKIYGIKNQNFADLVANAGATVQLTGEIDKDGKNLTVTKITAGK